MVYIFLIIGFILLVKGADYFVEGSSNLAKALILLPLLPLHVPLDGQSYSHIRLHADSILMLSSIQTWSAALLLQKHLPQE